VDARFDLRAAGSETQGRARSVGTVDLQMSRNKQKDRAVVRARLNDICPQDGFGAYLEVRIYYATNGTGYSSSRGSDTRGCRAKAKRVVLKTGFVKGAYRVTVRLFEYDAEAGNIAFLDEGQTEWTTQELRQ
jgi:hypothetical protein